MDMSLRIIGWLRAKGRSQVALAHGIGVHPSAVSLWCSASCKPSHQHLEAACAWLGITMSDFYGQIPDPVPKPKNRRRAVAPEAT